MTNPSLTQLEELASKKGLLLRLQVRRPLNLWSLRLVVARSINDESIQILGEMKAWAYGGPRGLQLDTMNVKRTAPSCVGPLIWSATMAWALEATPCKSARLLAIYDEDRQHARLIRYFLQRGFSVVKEVGSSPFDLPLRLIWGGAGALMTADCKDVLSLSSRRLLIDDNSN